ncbi:MAG: hypothetical protein NC320_08460 [Clostridium sp.]|nr:hypothetical protein [Clostridium sp.]
MKTAKRLLLILISAVMMIGGCGCGMFVSESQLRQTLENALQEKYNEEFSCLDVWSNGGSSYWGVCAPEKNHDIRFEVLFYDDGGILEEGYYAACVAEKIEENVQEELEYVFNDFYLHSYMPVPLYSRENDDIYAGNVRNESLDIAEYVEMANEKWKNETPTISLMICVNSSKTNKRSFEEEYDMLSNIILNINKLGMRTFIYLKFIPEKEYFNCIEYLEIRANTDSTFDNMVKDYSVKISNVKLNVHFECEETEYELLTKEEYIKQRKEVS